MRKHRGADHCGHAVKILGPPGQPLAPREQRLAPTVVAVLPLLLAGIAVLVYEWYIARTALEITGWQAAAAVALSVILDFIITYISSGMLRDPAG